MEAQDWRDLAEVLEAGERSARHKDPVLALALDAMARQCRRLASRTTPEVSSGGPASPTYDTGTPAREPVRPDHCDNCGGPGEALGWDPVDGWSCPACHASDADETGG
jgi:hypothetical protein